MHSQHNLFTVIMAGIECEFVEKPPKAFQSECPICLLVLREPYQATCCGKSFCKDCIEWVKANNQDCPTCNDKNLNLFHNLGLQQSLNDFEVYCSHKSKGCEWRGELRELDKHLNSDPPADKSLKGCPFTVISCPLSHTGCEVKLPRRDVKVHVSDDLLNHVLKQTALVLTLKEEKQYLEQRVTELERKVEKLEETQRVVSNTGQPIGPVEITMTNFHQHKNDEVWYSQPFYTHPHGYKMCLNLSPNGYGSGKGTHLGVFFHLMRGEFDDQLKWPFRGDITYQLVDQKGDKHHDVNTTHFNDRVPGEYSNRVTEKERNDNGWGISELLPLSELHPKYLKNDCIKLRILKIDLYQ